MHKTMLAALIVATSALSIPAFAQVNLGGAAQVGAGVNAGAVVPPVPNAMHTVNQTGAQATQTLHRADQRAKRMTHKAVDTTRSTVNNAGSADAGVNADSSMSAGNTNAGANTNAHAGVDAGAAASQATQTGQSIGDQASDTAHSAIQTTGNTAGSLGNTVNQTATGQSVDAAAKVNAKAATHGH